MTTFVRKGSPGRLRILERLDSHMHRAGWEKSHRKAIAIDPELENWLWAKSPHVAKALGWDSFDQLREWLAKRDEWLPAFLKPSNPKKAVELALRHVRKPRSSSIYRNATRRMTVRNCRDDGFLELSATLRRWFPTVPLVPLDG